MAFALFEHAFKVKKGEQLDLKIKLPEDNRGVVHGVVVDCYDKPIENAVVKLFKIKHHDGCYKEICPISHTFTDVNNLFV